MPTPSKGPRLGGSPAHERLILANLARSLFEHGRIATTETKAKRLRPVAEKLITASKRGTLHSRRQVLKTIRDKDVLHKLFAEIGPSFATRNGGYTRIVKTAPRKGDNAPMAIIELIDEETVSSAASRVARRAAGKSAAADSGSGRRGRGHKAGSADGVSEQDAASEQTVAAAGEEPAEGADVASAEASGAGVSGPDAGPDVEESSSTEEAPYGDGSHAPLEDGSAPEGFDIKGNADSMLYHVPGSGFYERTVAEVWFASAAAAEAAGFALPPSQRDDGADVAGADAE